jgi:hypothetical protein
MSENIFNGQTTDQSAVNTNGAAQQAPAVQNSDPFADLLGSIKNERGEPKYRDVQTALEALKYSQEYIPQIKTDYEKVKEEAEVLKREVERLKNIEQSVEQLASQQAAEQRPPAKVVSGEEIAQLVEQALTQRESLAVQKANSSTVVNACQQAFGAEAEKVFYTKAAELGLSANEMNALASKSPDAVLELLGLKRKEKQDSNFKPNAQTQINTSGYQPQNQSYIGKNTKPVILGASSEELLSEQTNAKHFVEELHSKGLTTYDLTDPKQYYKIFR